MPDAEPLATPTGPATPDAAGKRRGRASRRHVVAKAVLGTVVVLAVITGLGVTYYYRHLNGNLTVLDIGRQMVGERPAKQAVDGPSKPLNILVMGSDNRDCTGCNIDNLTGGGQRSDTTILLHLSADRTRAYGVSIPRDSMVDRPACRTPGGDDVPAEGYRMWNEAFSLAGPACTIAQFESLTGIRLDHFVVVDFEGFRSMVDAIGGVQVCIPKPIDDRAHGIHIPAGDRRLEGQQALNYVRERYAVGNGSDVGRMQRQQTFIASMAHAIVSSNTLANPVRVVEFLDAATKSLQLDEGLGTLPKIARLGYDFRGIGLDKIQFLTIPNKVDPTDPNRLVWTDDADVVWKKLLADQPLTKRLSTDVISAGNVPGGNGPSGTPSGTPSSTPSGSPTSQARTQELADAGLCT